MQIRQKFNCWIIPDLCHIVNLLTEKSVLAPVHKSAKEKPNRYACSTPFEHYIKQNNMNTTNTSAPSKTYSILALVIFLLITFAAAAVGGLFMPGEWYAELTKPSWNPPNWVFGPVWTTLYIMIATAGWLYWRTPSAASKLRGYGVYGLQLILNAAWTALFFGLHDPLLALIDISLLIVMIISTIMLFKSVNRVSAWLLVPYLTWVSYATSLNAAIWVLN